MAYDPVAMEKFFNPESVAIVGVSRNTGPGAFNILENLMDYGYKGRIYPVNPKATEILGVKCYARAQDLPEVPDLAIITVPREILPGVISDCLERGIRLFTLVPQGLAEADATGAAIQAEFMEAVRRHGARVLGPNTLGTVNTFDGFSSSFMPMERREPLGSSVICQTGLFLATDLGPTSGLGKGIDVGNQADVGFPDALRYLGEDEDIRVVAMHMEGLRPGEGRLFLEVAREAARRKPLLVYKTARSATGAQAAGSHSGSMAGSHDVYEAALDSAGIIRLRDVEDLDDAVKAFLFLPPMKGKRVFVVTVSGGGGIMAADACEDYGLELAQVSPETLKALQDIFPPWMGVGNPLDVWPAAIGKDYLTVFVQCFDLVAGDPNVDGIVCVGGTFGGGDPAVSDFLVLSAERRDKPITWWLHGKTTIPLARKAEESRKVAVYPSADRAVRALARLASYYVDIRGRVFEEPERPAGLPEPPGFSTSAAPGRRGGPGGGGAAVRRVKAAASRRVLGAEAFELLEGYGIPVPGWAVGETPEEAALAADRIGYPVVVKAVGPGVLHKSDLGLVRLDLTSAAAVLEAGRDVLGRAPGPDARLLVQRFLAGGHEVILGSGRDPHFGPTILFGLGGIFTEVLRDVAIGLAPLTRGEATALVKKTKGHAVLRGARGREPADLSALVDCMVRLSWLVADHTEIVELDLNPVKVFGVGAGCAAVDARIIVNS
ncbi:MAG: CoA-binding protein [Bacillota bacterium]|nr:MAG: CoA-binding protein [Bacillota bacterium]